jgi:hypothetical protein
LTAAADESACAINFCKSCVFFSRSRFLKTAESEA